MSSSAFHQQQPLQSMTLPEISSTMKITGVILFLLTFIVVPLLVIRFVYRQTCGRLFMYIRRSSVEIDDLGMKLHDITIDRSHFENHNLEFIKSLTLQLRFYINYSTKTYTIVGQTNEKSIKSLDFLKRFLVIEKQLIDRYPESLEDSYIILVNGWKNPFEHDVKAHIKRQCFYMLKLQSSAVGFLPLLLNKDVFMSEFFWYMRKQSLILESSEQQSSEQQQLLEQQQQSSEPLLNNSIDQTGNRNGSRKINRKQQH